MFGLEIIGGAGPASSILAHILRRLFVSHTSPVSDYMRSKAVALWRNGTLCQCVDAARCLETRGRPFFYFKFFKKKTRLLFCLYLFKCYGVMVKVLQSRLLTMLLFRKKRKDDVCVSYIYVNEGQQIPTRRRRRNTFSFF